MATKVIKIDKNIYICDYCGKEMDSENNIGDFNITISFNEFNKDRKDNNHYYEYGSNFTKFGITCTECAEKFANAAYFALKNVGFLERYELKNNAIEKHKKIIFNI